ncbi:hypothetical protein [Zongyangia hominis]|uniref:Lipoprotein n=1 Tax=Zongyangia hominis TaxID=2763677 RepID=A0A926IBS4_9FIRM|nr:hypothetical protein [Zongyangia hominis]MBC8570482.1 hypothetical protein [Zongyangia hominis]
MKRLLFLFLAILLLFTGCAAGDQTEQSHSTFHGTSSGGPLGKSSSASGGPASTQLQTLGRGSGNSKGFYRISMDLPTDGDTYALLLYVDYASRQEVPLCGKPSCAHNTDECTAYLPGSSFEYKILAEEDQLFLFYLPIGGGAVWIGGDGIEAAAPCLFSMNPDGTGRTKLLDLPTGTLLAEPIVYGGGNIYATAETTRMENGEGGLAQSVTENRRLVVFNTVQKTMEDVCSLHYFDLLVGAYDNRLLLKRYEFTENPNALSDSAYNALFSQTPVRLVSRDPATGEEKEHIAGKGGELDDLCVAGDTVYIGGPSSTIRRLTLADDQVSLLTDKLPAGRHWLEAEDDHVLVIYIDNQQVNADVTDVLKVDSETGELSPFTLFIKKPRERVSVLARNGEQYLVLCGYRSEEKKTWAGTHQVEIQGWNCALINVEDYWNNRDAYIPIQNSGENEGG